MDELLEAMYHDRAVQAVQKLNENLEQLIHHLTRVADAMEARK